MHPLMLCHRKLKKYPIKILGGLILGVYTDIPPVATPLTSMREHRLFQHIRVDSAAELLGGNSEMNA